MGNNLMTMDYDSDYILSARNMYTNHDSSQCGRHLGTSAGAHARCARAVAAESSSCALAFLWIWCRGWHTRLLLRYHVTKQIAIFVAIFEKNLYRNKYYRGILWSLLYHWIFITSIVDITVVVHPLMFYFLFGNFLVRKQTHVLPVAHSCKQMFTDQVDWYAQKLHEFILSSWLVKNIPFYYDIKTKTPVKLWWK